jgi:hypothetical protein
MKELLPGIYHWTANHPKIKIEVSSYHLPEEGVLIDPLVPDDGMDAFVEPPRHIYLTNRHHYRDSRKLVAAFGCTVWCCEAGMHEFTHGEEVRPFRFGDVLPGGVTALEIGAICPDETALLIPRGEGVVALADGVVRRADGPLGFVPDEYMGENPESVKAGLRKAYRGLLQHDFDHILLAHGWPWIGGGKRALEEFIEGRG